MPKVLKIFLYSLVSLHRYLKRAIVIITDIFLCIICTWLAFVLRLEELILFRDFNFIPAAISIVFAIPIFWSFGLYRTIYRFSGTSMILNILASTFLWVNLFSSSIYLWNKNHSK